MHTIQPQPVEADPSPAQTLRDAAVYLARCGWTQGEMFDNPERPTPAACVFGAIRMAVCGGPLETYTDGQAAQVGFAVRVFARHLDTVYWAGLDSLHEDTFPDDVV